MACLHNTRPPPPQLASRHPLRRHRRASPVQVVLEEANMPVPFCETEAEHPSIYRHQDVECNIYSPSPSPPVLVHFGGGETIGSTHLSCPSSHSADRERLYLQSETHRVERLQTDKGRPTCCESLTGAELFNKREATSKTSQDPRRSIRQRRAG
jgi:hypothetical protein